MSQAFINPLPKQSAEMLSKTSLMLDKIISAESNRNTIPNSLYTKRNILVHVARMLLQA